MTKLPSCGAYRAPHKLRLLPNVNSQLIHLTIIRVVELVKSDI